MTLFAPAPSAADLRTNATFNAVMWALRRPGKIMALPHPGEAALIDTLLDRECRVFCADPLLVPQVLRAGATIAELAEADHVFLGTCTDATLLRGLSLGSDLYPDEGATVVMRASLGAGTKLRLRGPGVNGSCDVTVSGLPDGFWEVRKQVMRYPTGFELLLLDGDHLMALPRSTDVEVL